MIAVSVAALALAAFVGWVLMQMAPASPGGGGELLNMLLGFLLALAGPLLIYVAIQKLRGKDLT
jgi:hypothetical protein